MGRSYTLIHFPCLGMARVGCSITNSYLDRGASRRGGIPPQPYLAILSFQMIGNFSLQSYFGLSLQADMQPSTNLMASHCCLLIKDGDEMLMDSKHDKSQSSSAPVLQFVVLYSHPWIMNTNSVTV
jgi:hypothetical protein